jgi:hypothetical protein
MKVGRKEEMEEWMEPRWEAFRDDISVLIAVLVGGGGRAETV